MQGSSPLDRESKKSQKPEVVIAILLSFPGGLHSLLSGPLITYGRRIPSFDLLFYVATVCLMVSVAYLCFLAYGSIWKAFFAVILCNVAVATLPRVFPPERFARELYSAERAQYESCAKWMIENNSESNFLKLPNQFRQISFHSEAEVIKNSNGIKVLFPLHCHDFDNELGLAFSSNGLPPTMSSRCSIVETERINEHWFVYRTT